MQETIREATSDDIPALNALFVSVFGVERDEKVWNWKYFDNPRGTASFLCEAGGRVVTHCGGTPVLARTDGGTHLALQSTDFMSSPSYPGGIGRGGVFVRTVEAFFRAYCGPAAVPMVYGFPGERHRLLGERLLGYRAVEPVCDLQAEPVGEGLQLRPLEEADLSLFSSPQPEFGAVRDEVYLRWRYLHHPSRSYSVVRVRRLLGLAGEAAAIVTVDGSVLRVMEWGGDLGERTLGSLVSELRRGGLTVIAWGGATHPVTRALERAGLSVRPRDHSIECRMFAGSHPPPGRFYFTTGDYDVY